MGFDEPTVLDAALKRGAIDHKAATPEAAVRDADLVVLATPLAPMLQLLETIASHLKPGALVTDVGSVKQPVMEHARDVLLPENRFIGGHPMAGAEHRGVAYADAFLFENATYVLCPSQGTPDDYFTDDEAGFLAIVRATGGRVLLMDAARHDRIAAAVSHLPQLLSVLLMNYVADLNTNDEAFLRLAAGGFRDMTRIASSPFGMWRDVLLANQHDILDALAGFTTLLQKMRNRLIEEDLDTIATHFAESARVRDTIPRDSKGFLSPLSDVYVYAEDRPGELLSIVQVLFNAGINIKDIELLKIREGTGGAFRLSFSGDLVAAEAIAVLTGARFHAYRL